MRVHCEKKSLYTTFWLTWMCSHDNVLIEARVCIQLVTQFPMLYSTVMFPRSVLTTRRVNVHVRTLRDGCVHTFLTYEVMSMRNFKHITPCLSHNFYTHALESRNKVPPHDFLTYYALCNFDLQGRLRVQIVTYEDVSVCNVSQNFYVLSRPPYFYALCRLRDVFMCVFVH